MRRFGLLVAGLALLAGVAATVSGGATQAKARWVITDLGTLGGRRAALARFPRITLVWQARSTSAAKSSAGPIRGTAEPRSCGRADICGHWAWT